MSGARGPYAGWNNLCVTCLKVASGSTGCPRSHVIVLYHAARAPTPKRTARKKTWEAFLRAVLTGERLAFALKALAG
jgi:hypothetical protein